MQTVLRVASVPQSNKANLSNHLKTRHKLQYDDYEV